MNLLDLIPLLKDLGNIAVIILFMWFIKNEREAKAKETKEEREIAAAVAKEERAERQSIEEKRLETLKHIGDECHQHSRQMIATMSRAMEQSTIVNKECTRVLGSVQQVLTSVQASILGRTFERTDPTQTPNFKS
ncbi:MAG: hypothetical protein ABJZ55_02025 [Fuerstiella sp.]